MELRLGEDGTLTDKDGRTVGRLTADHQVMPMQGVDIPGLFHGPAATPPEGRDPGKTLPPSPGTSTTSEADRKTIEQSETRPISPTLPGTAVTPVPAQSPAENVQPGRETVTNGPQVVTMASPTPRDGVVGGKPRGVPEPTPRSADPQTQEGLRLQQQSLDAMNSSFTREMAQLRALCISISKFSQPTNEIDHVA